MGAWGYAIFSDDEACDVRDEYRDHIGDGMSGPEATQAVLSEYAESLKDPDSGPVVWLALAATQWKCGRLEDEVRAKALEIIDTGKGLQLWEDEGPQALKKRKAALAKLRDQLLSPQPPVKRIPKRVRLTTDLRVGDALSYRLKSGNFVIVRIDRIMSDKGGDYPVYTILNWRGQAVPPRWRIALMKPIRGTSWLLIPIKNDVCPADRIAIVAHDLRTKESVGISGTFWSNWDNVLERDYGIS